MQTRPNYPWHIDLPRGRRPIKVFKTYRGEYVAGVKMPNGNYLTHDFADGYMQPSHLELFDHSDIVGAANGGIVRSYPTEVEAVAQLLQSIHVFMHGPKDDSLLHYPEVQKWRKLRVAQVFGEPKEQSEMRTNPTQHHDLDIAELAARQNPLLFRNNEEAHEYGRMVADAYRAAPSFDEKEAWRWHLLADHISKMFKRIQRGKQGVEVIFVPGQPYDSAEQLKREVAKTKKLYISTDYNTHPIFTPEQNLEFRAVHDYIVHIGRDVDFSMRGEAAAYNAHARLAPPDTMPALFTEIVGQAAPSNVYGVFDEQKIALLPFDYYNVGIEVTGARPNRLTPNQRGQLTALVDEDKSRRSKLGRKRANPAGAGYLVRTVNANTGEVNPALDIAEFRLDHADDPEMLAALDWIESGSNEVPVGGYILQRVTEEALEDERVRDQIAFDEWEAEKYNEMNRLRYEDEDDDTRDNRLTPNQRGQLTALVDEDKSRRSKLGRKRSNITPEGRDERLTVLREARANRLTPNQRGQLDLLVAEDVERRSKLGRRRTNGAPDVDVRERIKARLKERGPTTGFSSIEASPRISRASEDHEERMAAFREAREGDAKARIKARLKERSPTTGFSSDETRANAPGDRQRRRKRGEHEHLLAQIQMTSRLLAEAEMNRPPREVERLSRMLDSLVDQAEQEGLRAQAEWSMRHGRHTGVEHTPAASEEYDYPSAHNPIFAAQDAEESRLLRGSSTRGSARANRLTSNQRGQLTALVDEDKSRRSKLGRKRANGSVDGVHVQMVDPETGNIVSEDTLAQFRADNAHDPEVSAALDWIDAGSVEVPVGLYILRRVGDEARENRLTPNQRGQLTALVDEDKSRRSKLGRKRANSSKANSEYQTRTVYRGGPSSSLSWLDRNTTLADVIAYEHDELGNEDVVLKVTPEEAKTIKARNLNWVCFTREDAQYYAFMDGEETDEIEEREATFRVVAVDGQNGYLIEEARENRLTPNQRGQLTALVDEDKSRRSRLGRKRANPTASHFGPTETDAELLKALTLARKHLGHRSGPFHDDVPHATRDAAMKELVRIEAEAQARGVRKNPTARERAALEMLIAEHDGRAAKRGYTAAKKSAAKRPAAKPAAKKPAAKKPAAKPAAKRTKK